MKSQDRHRTVPQYAAAEGISVVAAHKRLKRIGLRVKRGQLIDTDAVNAKWRQVSDAKQGTRNPGGGKKPKAPAAASHAEPREPDPDRSSLAEAQRAKEWLAVKEKKLKLDREEGRLVVAAEVAQEWSRMIGAARSMALLMPDKLAPKVAAVADVRECRQIIAAEVNAMLSGLSEYRPNE